MINAKELEREAAALRTATPTQEQVDALAAIVAEGAIAEEALLGLPELARKVIAARQARHDLEALFAAAERVRERLGDAGLPPLPVRPVVPAEPPQFRRYIELGRPLTYQLG